MKRGGIIVGTIVLIIIAVIFLMVFSKLLYDFFGNIPTVRGAIGDSTAVVCFGGGKDSTVHCLTKENGTEIFYFEAARKWRERARGAYSTPALVPEGDIFFGVTNRFCAYNKAGQNKWSGCKRYDEKIPTGAALSENYVCFGGGEDKQVHCLDKGTGEGVDFSSPEEVYLRGPAISTPVLEDNILYYGIGAAFRKQNLETVSEGYDWQQFRGSMIISTDLAVSENYICYGSTHDYEYLEVGDVYGIYYCYNKTNREPVLTSISSSYKDEGGVALSTPAIDEDEGFIYFGLENVFRKYPLNVGLGWAVEVGGDISTGIALGEGVVCFGDGKGHTMHCFNETSDNAVELFSVTASELWDKKNAESTPIILDGIIYFGLGDHVCAYNITNSSTSKEYEGDENALWCADFDYLIPTGIAGLPAKKII